MSSSKGDVPDSVVKATRAVLLSSVKGVTLRNFTRDYVSLLGERFPWMKLGYGTAKDLLAAMPDTVRFEYSEKDADYRLYGIGTKEMFMPSWVVKAQGNTNKPSEIAQTPPRVSVGVGKRRGKGDGTELVYSARGLVTVHISWDYIDDNLKKKIPLEKILDMKDLLTKLIPSVAVPVEVSVHPGCFAFVRFSFLEEAQKVLEKFNGLRTCGVHFKSQPAKEKMPQGKVKPVVKSSKTGKKRSDGSSKGIKIKPKWLSKQTRSKGLSSHDCHVTSVEERAHSAKSCDSGNDIVSGSHDQLHSQSHDHSRNGCSRLRYLDTLGISDSESDSSDVEWDYDLLDHPERSMAAGGLLAFEELDDEDYRVELSGKPGANKWGLTPIRIAEVVTPDQIWIQFGVSPELDLQCISSSVSASQPDPLTEEELTVGVCCAMLTSKGGEGQQDTYRRARVMEVSTAQFVKQPQASLELIDIGSTVSGVALCHLYTLPHRVNVGVVPPLSIPTAIEGLHSTFNYGDEWFPLDRQLLWEHLRHKTVFAKVMRKPSGKQVGVVDLYFDPMGHERVCDLLIKKGLFLSSKRPVLKTPPKAPPIQLETVAPPQTNTKLSRLASLIKKSVAEKYSSQEIAENSNIDENGDHSLLESNGTEPSCCKQAESAGGCGVGKMPPLECCSVSGDDWWTDESDECSLNDSRRLSSRSHVTNSYGLKTDHVTDDDDDDW